MFGVIDLHLVPLLVYIPTLYLFKKKKKKLLTELHQQVREYAQFREHCGWLTALVLCSSNITLIIYMRLQDSLALNRYGVTHNGFHLN